jgi:regulator of sigma E protease
VFALLVLFHEFGHFMLAKMTGMRVDEFAIGFGPKLAGFKKGETQYSVRCIPLGGFNRISGMDPEDVQDERSYKNKPVWARMAVILAGSFMNFVLPVILFIIIFISSGISTPSQEPVLGKVIENKAAAAAGLAMGDRILEINSEKVESWRDFVAKLQQGEGKVLAVKYERGGAEFTTSLIPEYDEASKKAIIGVMSSVDTRYPSAAESVGLAFSQTGYIIFAILDGLWQIVAGTAEADLAGPIGVAQMAGQVAQLGFVPLLQFAAYLSINLGIINLLPLPALDGGHFVLLCLEFVRRKPLSDKCLQYVQAVGVALLLSLMLLATYRDFLRFNLFGG